MRRITWLVVLTVVAVLLGGCGSEKDKNKNRNKDRPQSTQTTDK
jgi:hypothetical protein